MGSGAYPPPPPPPPRGPWNIVSAIYHLSLIDDRYSSFPDESSQAKSLNLQLPFAQGKDGKSFLNFGKNVIGAVMISVENVY